MRKKMLLVFLLILLTPCFWAGAQKLEKFSGDSTKFMGELSQLFSNTVGEEQKRSENLIRELLLKWDAEKFNPASKQFIYSTANQMLRKRLRAYPDFYSFFEVLNLSIDKSIPEDRFIEWSAVVRKLIAAKNSRPFLSFLETSGYLFSENALYHSESAVWKTQSSDYWFSMDSVPVISFAATDLTCLANKDSLVIRSTKGVFYPLTSRWEGNGGTVDWIRAGLDPSSVYANLGIYRINMKFPRFSADSVEFHNRKFFDRPLTGKFIDKVQVDISEEKASYPRFSSNDKEIGIRNLFKNIDYLGGFDMEGAKIIGSGDAASPARVSLKKDDKELVAIRAMVFIIRPDRINSALASVTIRHEEDSIYHPGLQMKYIDEKKELTCYRDERLNMVSPWFDSWHHIEIYCESLTWNVEDPKIQFEMMKGPNQEGKAVFESTNYYSLQRYEKLQGIDEINPVNAIKQFADQKKTMTFTLEDLSEYFRKPQEQVEGVLLTLANKGFLIYDIDNRRVTLRLKLYQYVLARAGKVDYDVIYFNSAVSGKSNGVLDLPSFDLKIQGVRSVFLSDSQQVNIFPKNEEVILKKDRDFLFSGKVEAGLFDIYTQNASFDYNSFKLNLPVIDSMGFFVVSRTRDPKTQKFPLIKVKTMLTGLSGDLLIDDPQNKSGLKPYPDYPVFNSKNASMANWEKKEIMNGVYRKDKFFYSVDPFTFKNLARFPTDSLKFSGSLVSAGIFPDIRQPLKVRPDYSFGIELKTDSAGLPTYGGKGTFGSGIDMSNQGLRGDGTFRYLNSISCSKNFIFYPDSMRSTVRTFDAVEVASVPGFPVVHGDSVGLFWLPYRDSLTVKTLRRDLNMYANQSGFAGRIYLTPSGLTGNGTVKIRDAEMDSKNFQFKNQSFDANIANFRIKSYDLSELSISTKNYQTHFDFRNKKGEFKSNVGISKVEFPFNKYICSMDRFDWMIDNKEITLTNERNSKLAVADTLTYDQLMDFQYPGAEFISVHPDQDSLRFFAFRAVYNLVTNVINAEDVKIVKVADAGVFPDSGKVCILKNAQIRPLKRAGIIADGRTKYHHFYNGDVSITSRRKYAGQASYDYVDRENNRQQIRFTKIGVDSTGQTVASGNIPDSAGFQLSPEFAFQGDVTLIAGQKNLRFEGGFSILNDCFSGRKYWTYFNALIDPKQLQIPVSPEPRDIRNERLGLGLLFSNTQNRIYPAFFGKKESFSDSLMVTSEGILDYQAEKNEFRVMKAEKMKNQDERGNVIRFAPENCRLQAQGKLNLGMNAPPLRMETYGTMDYFILADSAKADVAIALNPPFSETAGEKFANQLNAVNLAGLVFSTSPYFLAIQTILEKKEFDKVKAEMDMVGKVRKFPQELERTFFLADVNLRWDSTSKSWVSYGPIGIGSIGKIQVNRYVKGVVEMTKKRNGDEFSFYFELTKDDWYFFNYRNNIFQVISSNLEFNEQITNAMKSKSEQNRMDNLSKGYRYIISTDRKKRDFLKKFQTEEE